MELPLPLFAAEANASEDVELELQLDRREPTQLTGRVNQQPIRTIGQATEHLHELMQRQVLMAVEQRVAFNVTGPGDSATRITFYTLLPDVQQREVFVRIAGQPQAWPRLRALFGAPPYGFLRPEDAGMLRAAGVAPGRTNMTHDEVQSAASYSQFGTGQLVDELGREYKVVRRNNVRESDSLACNFDVYDTPYILLQVRVKKRRRIERMEMLRDNVQRLALAFPRVGERVLLTQTPRLLRIQGIPAQQAPPPTPLQIRRVVPRGTQSATAALLAVMS